MSEWTPKVGDRVLVQDSIDAQFDNCEGTIVRTEVGTQWTMRVQLDGNEGTWPFDIAELTHITTPAPEPAGDDSDWRRMDASDRLAYYTTLPGSRGLVGAYDAIILELDTFEAMRSEVAALRTENARLIAALQDIADKGPDHSPGNYQEAVRYWCSRYQLAVGIAQDALKTDA